MMTATPTPAIGTALPLLFTYRDCLFGNGFVVEVHAINGRALCVQERDGSWMYGVNPGGMAANGDDPLAAHGEFRQAFSAILKALAHEANSFDEFRALVTDFFNDTNPGHERAWNQAVDALRSDNSLAAALQIPRVPADSPRSIHVEMKQLVSVRADDNDANLEPALAA